MTKRKHLALVLFFSLFAADFTKASGNEITNFVGDSYAFLLSVIKNPTQMGATLPSSPFLAKAITKHIKNSKKTNKRILEVGAGTGSFTREIVKLLHENDILDVVEVDPELCKVLQAKFEEFKNVHIHNISILNFKKPYEYDHIVSGLPFNAFEISFVKEVLNKYQDFIINNGTISYFEYAILPSVMKLFMTIFLMNEKKQKRIAVFNEIQDFKNSFSFYKKNLVLNNFPPAYVHTFKKQPKLCSVTQIDDKPAP
ncbi:methyltransferase domain-containing protein [Candidatus Babeliales bacterium]|nr:methyltransferase domain-containing protein [Candidatus Babeliales bacterium]